MKTMPDSDDAEETESTTPESDDAEDVTSEAGEGDEVSSDEVEDAEVGEVEDEAVDEAGEEDEGPDEEDEVPEGTGDEETETADAEGVDEEAETGDEEDEQVEAEEADSEELEEIETAMSEEQDVEDGEGLEDEEEEPPSQPVVKSEGRFYGTGRRKESVARVWIESGSGEVRINDTSLEAYFSSRPKWTEAVRAPLECVGMEDQVDVWATADGGGLTGQADALQLGVARALVEMDENARYWLRPEGHLTRDDREVERKKINQPGARAKSQVSKR